MDCDEQHEPERIPDFIRAIRTDQWDIISGSRYLQTRLDDDLPPGDRRAINATITAMLNDMFDWNLTDSFCGFKAHRISAMRKLHLDRNRLCVSRCNFGPQVYKPSCGCTEIPVRLIYNDPTRTFGGVLDDAQRRLGHYLDVFNA